MKSMIILVAAALLTASCTNYRLSSADAGKTMTLKGTVLAVERDGDLLLESGGRMAFIDVADTNTDVEMGQQVIITGEVEHDANEGEAPELDAVSIEPWIR